MVTFYLSLGNPDLSAVYIENREAGVTCAQTSPDGQTKIRLIIFFAAKDGDAVYSKEKQDWELTVAQIINSLLPNSY